MSPDPMSPIFEALWPDLQQMLMAQKRQQLFTDPGAAQLFGFASAPPGSVPLQQAVAKGAFSLLPRSWQTGYDLTGPGIGPIPPLRDFPGTVRCGPPPNPPCCGSNDRPDTPCVPPPTSGAARGGGSFTLDQLGQLPPASQEILDTYEAQRHAQPFPDLGF